MFHVEQNTASTKKDNVPRGTNVDYIFVVRSTPEFDQQDIDIRG